MGLEAVRKFLANNNIRSAEMAAELKRLVESHELVESYGGLSKCKFIVVDPMTMFDTSTLKQAIADVEACQ